MTGWVHLAASMVTDYYLKQRLRPFRRGADHRVFSPADLPPFPGGVFNPSGVVNGDEVLILARGEKFDRQTTFGSSEGFLNGWAPVLIRCSRDMRIKSASVLRFEGCREGHRAEDYRLFRAGERLLALYTQVDGRRWWVAGGPDWPRFSTSQHVAELDQAAGVLRHIATPELDFPIAFREKNWVVFEIKGRLFLLYSFDPYRVLEVVDPNEFACRTVVLRQPKLPRLPRIAGRFVSLGTNPIEYDERHYLTLVHRRDRNGVYGQWGVLIDRETLLPVGMTRAPIFRGEYDRRRWASGIVYTMGVLRMGEDFVFLNGLGDEECGWQRIPKSQLDLLFEGTNGAHTISCVTAAHAI